MCINLNICWPIPQIVRLFMPIMPQIYDDEEMKFHLFN